MKAKLSRAKLAKLLIARAAGRAAITAYCVDKFIKKYALTRESECVSFFHLGLATRNRGELAMFFRSRNPACWISDANEKFLLSFFQKARTPVLFVTPVLPVPLTFPRGGKQAKGGGGEETEGDKEEVFGGEGGGFHQGGEGRPVDGCGGDAGGNGCCGEELFIIKEGDVQEAFFLAFAFKED